MRLSELSEREIINISTGNRHNDTGEADLLFDEKTGKIKALLVPEYENRGFFGGGKEYIQLPWSSIKRIGEDIIIVDMDL